MTKVIGVRFRTAGKIYYFGPKDIEFKRADHVIVETARGVEYGTVVLPNMEVDDSKITQPLKNVIRKATNDDDEREKRNREKEKDAYKVCQEKILKHGLEMKLINAEYTFDNNKVLFYFTADGRVDFRELVKDLAGVFRTRIELRQVGVRDETKILGGMGICGRPLCGLKGEVRETNVLKQLVKVVVEIDDEKELREYAVSDLKFKPRHKKSPDEKAEKGQKRGKNKDNKNRKSHEELEEELELEELERLEQKDGKSKLDDD